MLVRPEHTSPPGPARPGAPPLARRIARLVIAALALVGVLLLGPLGTIAVGAVDPTSTWRSGSRESSGQSPTPEQEPRAVVQVFAARTVGWRGAFGVHTWIATKRSNATEWTVHHVIGWRVFRGSGAVVTQAGPPDFRWFGAWPDRLVDLRGDGVDATIDRIEAAVAAYPYPDTYRAWPGPNSNTFTAFVARQVPELGLDLPPTALGKDYLANGDLLAPMPSGTGWQLSLAGLLGLGLAWEEGVEVNVLGLSTGLDVNDLGLRLPGIGRITLSGRG